MNLMISAQKTKCWKEDFALVFWCWTIWVFLPHTSHEFNIFHEKNSLFYFFFKSKMKIITLYNMADRSLQIIIINIRLLYLWFDTIKKFYSTLCKWYKKFEILRKLRLDLWKFEKRPIICSSSFWVTFFGEMNKIYLLCSVCSTIYTMCTEQWTWLKSSLDVKSSKTFL